MYIVGEITNKVVAGFNRKKLVIIISPFSEIIGWTIIQHIGRGVTFLNGEGAYSHKNQKVNFCSGEFDTGKQGKTHSECYRPDSFYDYYRYIRSCWTRFYYKDAGKTFEQGFN